MASLTGACCGCMVDTLKQAVLGYVRSVHDVDNTAHCSIVIRTCKSADTDVSLIVNSSHQHTAHCTVHAQQPKVMTMFLILLLRFSESCTQSVSAGFLKNCGFGFGFGFLMSAL